MRTKLLASIVSAVLYAGLLAAPAASDPVPDDDCGPTGLGCETDLDWANDLEDMIADNIWDGQVYEIDYDPFDNEGNPLPRKRQHVAKVTHYGDSALWTGTYLGAQSFRYAIAEKKLADGNVTGDDRAYWTKSRKEAKARIDDMVRKFHILINISKHWNHQRNVSHEQAGFGGGVIAGESGHLMRACIDEKAPEWQRWSNAELARPETGPESMAPYTGKPRVFGPFPWRDQKTGEVTNYLCEDGTSRDAYAGTIFGLLLAFDLVDDHDMRVQIRDDIVAMSNYALKYLWFQPRPHGRVRLPLDEAGPSCDDINAVLKVCGHDFENFISDLFIRTPWARMEMAQAAHHVTMEEQKPAHPDTAKWQAVYVSELAQMTPFLAFSHLFDAGDPYGSYYKWNLEHLISFNLVRQAPNAVAKAVYKQGIGVMDATTGDDDNAHFEAITYGLTGENHRLTKALEHLREWPAYRQEISDGVPYNNTCKPNGEHVCVPKDRRDMEVTPGGERVMVFPGTSGERSLEPLRVAKRWPSDFIWQREPNKLKDDDKPPGPEHQYPGIDYLLPYWMLRYLTEVAGPDLGPLGPWPGPSFH